MMNERQATIERRKAYDIEQSIYMFDKEVGMFLDYMIRNDFPHASIVNVNNEDYIAYPLYSFSISYGEVSNNGPNIALLINADLRSSFASVNTKNGTLKQSYQQIGIATSPEERVDHQKMQKVHTPGFRVLDEHEYLSLAAYMRMFLETTNLALPDTEFYKALDQPDSQFRHEQILKKEYEILQPLD